MSAEYMHVGIPVLNKKPNMVYNEWGGFWVNESVDEYDYKIEYLKFEEGTRFPKFFLSSLMLLIWWMIWITTLKMQIKLFLVQSQ